MTAEAVLINEPAMKPEDVINLEAYPISNPDDPRRKEIVDRCKQHLDTHQYCVLPEFIRPAARLLAVDQAMSVRHLAHHNCASRNCYLQRDTDPSFPDDHPRNILLDATTRMLAYDLLPKNSPLKALYHWDSTKRMIAEIVGIDQLFDNDDPFQPANTLMYEDGDRSSWHFDSVNAFTMTLMLQAPETGGRFEMAPNSRTDDDQNYDYVREILQEKRPEDIVEVGREEGALCIFRGCNSLHRVSPVAGDRLRIMGVFVYETEPGIKGDPEVNETVYGSRVSQVTA